MPKRKQIEPPDEQSKRFTEDVQRMIDAGELSPTEADAALDSLVRKALFTPKGEPGDSG